MATDDDKPMNRDQVRIAERQLRATRYYLRGRPARWIAQKLNVSHTQVLRDLRAVQEEWQKEAIDNLDAAKKAEVQRLYQLEQTYWEAWQRSVGRHTVERSETSTGERGGSKDSTVSENLAGDPRFLAGVERCIERRCKLLGHDAPLKVDNTHRGFMAVERDLIDGVAGKAAAGKEDP